jgi:Nif-specific regulatory protein
MRLMDRQLGAVRSALFLADPLHGSLLVEAAYGVSPNDFRTRYGGGVAGRVAEAGRAIVVPSVRREPMALSELADPASWRDQSLSLVSVPITLEGRCAGALSVYFTSTATKGFAARLAAVQDIAASMALGLAARPSSDVAPSEPTGRAVFEYANMIGSSAVMRQVYEEIGQVAQTTATALILGESGTGKELVAEAIHANSDRAKQPFIKINGASFPETLFESELFGHERGAFTGAVGRRKGRLDRAQGGTLFLDEIAELPLSTQVKLLRVLQFREYDRLGGTETLRADVRLIAATNKNIAGAVAAGTFREDLFYRLNVFTITLPPLRERPGDIPALAEYFLDKCARQHRRSVRRVSTGALDLLCGYAWPGNVRELENAIERAVIVCGGFVLEERHLPEPVRTATRVHGRGRRSLAEAVAGLERSMIEEALEQSQGNLARAARALGTTERVLRYKVEKYGLAPRRSRAAPEKQT